MSDRALRTALIKLASEHPEFRKDLLPIIKSAAASNGGYDEMNVGKVKPGGSAEGTKGKADGGGSTPSDADKPWIKGEFTQQEFHELGDKQEKGQLGDGKVDDGPAKVAKIKAVVKTAKTAREAGEQAYKVACSCGEAPVAAVEVAKKAVHLWKKQNQA
jgi:hypothetical protein